MPIRLPKDARQDQTTYKEMGTIFRTLQAHTQLIIQTETRNNSVVTTPIQTIKGGSGPTQPSTPSESPSSTGVPDIPADNYTGHVGPSQAAITYGSPTYTYGIIPFYRVLFGHPLAAEKPGYYRLDKLVLSWQNGAASPGTDNATNNWTINVVFFTQPKPGEYVLGGIINLFWSHKTPIQEAGNFVKLFLPETAPRIAQQYAVEISAVSTGTPANISTREWKLDISTTKVLSL